MRRHIERLAEERDRIAERLAAGVGGYYNNAPVSEQRVACLDAQIGDLEIVLAGLGGLPIGLVGDIVQHQGSEVS